MRAKASRDVRVCGQGDSEAGECHLERGHRGEHVLWDPKYLQELEKSETADELLAQNCPTCDGGGCGDCR